VLIGDDFGGGRPIIFDTSSQNVFGGIAPGEYVCIARDVAGFYGAVANLIDIVYGKFSIWGVSEDGILKDYFLEALENAIKIYTSPEKFDGFVDYFYG
jgi:hypothetical protein